MGLIAAIPSPTSNRIEIGPINVTFYGILIALGVVAAMLLAARRWEQRGGTAEDLYRIGTWSVLAGLVGARVAYILPRLDTYLPEPRSMLAIWEGGLSIFGGLIGGLGVGYLLARRAGLSLPDLFDAAAPGLPLAQAIGRWGNYFNQELYGRPTDLPWGLRIDIENRPIEYIDAATFHPTFLYESLWNLGIVAVLLRLDRRRVLGRGNVFLLYAALYGAGRFWIELLRVDTDFRVAGVFSRNAFFALAVAVVAGTLLAVRQRRRSAGETGWAGTFPASGLGWPGDEPEPEPGESLERAPAPEPGPEPGDRD